MSLVYYDPFPNDKLQSYIESYSRLLVSNGEPGVTCTRLDSIEDVLKTADVFLQCDSIEMNCSHSRLSVCIAIWTERRITW